MTDVELRLEAVKIAVQIFTGNNDNRKSNKDFFHNVEVIYKYITTGCIEKSQE